MFREHSFRAKRLPNKDDPDYNDKRKPRPRPVSVYIYIYVCVLSLWYQITILDQDGRWRALVLGPTNTEVQSGAREGSKPSNNALPGPP